MIVKNGVVARAVFPIALVPVVAAGAALLPRVPDVFPGASRAMLISLPSYCGAALVILLSLVTVWSVLGSRGLWARLVAGACALFALGAVGVFRTVMLTYPDELCFDRMMVAPAATRVLAQAEVGARTWTVTFRRRGAMGDGVHPMITLDFEPKPKRRIYRCVDRQPHLERWLDQEPRSARIELDTRTILLDYEEGNSDVIPFD